MSSYADVIEDTFTALSGLTVDVSADIRQRGDVIPAVIFTMEDAEFTRTTVESQAPVHVRMRFDCLHDSRLEAEALAGQVVAQINASSLTAGLESNSTDLFSRGADVEPVYLTSSVFVITCGSL